MQTNTPNLPSWAESMVEPLARAICKTKGIEPDCLYQHNFEGDYPEDERRSYADPFTGEPRVQLFHRAWRHSVPAATAALAEALPMVLTEVERHLSACQYDPAPYTCLKHRLRTLSDGEGE